MISRRELGIFGMLILFDDEDEILTLIGISNIRNEFYYSREWANNILTSGVPIQVNRNFRFSSQTIQRLASIFKPLSKDTTHNLTKKFCCMLFNLGRKISYEDLGARFGVTKSTAYNWVQDTIELVLKKKSEFLKMPSLMSFRY